MQSDYIEKWQKGEIAECTVLALKGFAVSGFMTGMKEMAYIGRADNLEEMYESIVVLL